MSPPVPPTIPPNAGAILPSVGTITAAPTPPVATVVVNKTIVPKTIAPIPATIPIVPPTITPI